MILRTVAAFPLIIEDDSNAELVFDDYLFRAWMLSELYSTVFCP